MIQKIKTFFDKAQNYSTKEFLIYLCVNFSLLFNGLFLIIIGEVPVLLESASENVFRVISGSIFIALWFVFLPTLSRDAKDKIMYNITYSLLTLLALISLSIYWLTVFNSSSFIAWDILAIIVSIPTVAYLIYLIVNFFKLIFFIFKKILNILLPEATEKRGLLYTLEAITSIFLAISSLVAAFWGIITALRTILEYLNQ